MLAGAVDWNALEQVAAPSFKGKGIGEIVSAVLPYIFTIAGLLMLFYLIYSGFQYMMSSGDPKTLEQAKKNITYAIIGFMVIFASYWIVAVFGNVLNLGPLKSMFSP